MNRLIVIAVVALLAAGCRTAEGDVFSSLQDGGAGGSGTTACDPTPAVLGEAALVRIGSALAGEPPVVTAMFGDAAHALTFDLASGAAVPLGSTLLASRSLADRAQPLEAAGGARTVLFGNHALAGSWHVYIHGWTAGEALAFGPSLVRVSDEGSENIGPRAAYRGSELGVAYRQDTALAFARVRGDDVLSRHIGEPALPHPDVARVLAIPAGHVVLYHRAESRAAFFDAEGKPAGETNLGGYPADGFVLGTTPTFVVARAGGLDLVTTTGGPAGTAKPLGSGPKAAVLTLRAIAAAGGGAWIAWIEADAGGGSAAHIGRLRGDRLDMIGSRALVPASRPAVELVEHAGRVALVVAETTDGRERLEASAFCAP